MHAAFRSMEHVLNVTECESWLNLGEGEMELSSLPVQLPEGIVVEHVESCNSWSDQHPATWLLMKSGLRKKYFSPSATHKSPTPQFITGAVNVAVHVRRGDVLEKCSAGSPDDHSHEMSRCIPNAYTASVMQQVAARLAAWTSLPINLQVRVQVLSQCCPFAGLVTCGPVSGSGFPLRCPLNEPSRRAFVTLCQDCSGI